MQPQIYKSMKSKLKIVLGTLFLSLVMVACGEKNSPTNSDDNYYVRYSLESTPSIITKVSYADVNEIKTETLDVKSYGWTVTIGPVKKGFRSYVRTEEYTARATIEVCKNSEPFTVKAKGIDSASYTIDF